MDNMTNKDKPCVSPVDLILELWFSEKTNVEEKKLLDDMSIKPKFRLSERVKLINMYEDKIGPLTGKILWKD